MGDLNIFTGNGSVGLARAVAEALGTRVSEATVGKWSNDEIAMQLHEGRAGNDVFIFQSTR